VFLNDVLQMDATEFFEKYVKFVERTVTNLREHFESVELMFDLVNPKVQTMGYLLIMYVEVQELAKRGVSIDLIPKLKNFLAVADLQQLKMAKFLYYDFFHHYTLYVAEKPEFALRSLTVLKAALEKMQVPKTTLTPVHSDLLLLSLKAKAFKLALVVMEEDINNFDNGYDISEHNQSLRKVHYNTKYVLLYYYYGGMIQAAVCNYTKSLFHFAVCMLTPATAVSAIVLEAFKKYMLVSFIEHGTLKITYSGKFAHTAVLKALVPPIYNELHVACTELQINKARKIISEGKSVFQADWNYGLAKRIVPSLYRRKIMKLALVYYILPLTDLAQHCELPNIETARDLVFQMISKKELRAKIDEKIQAVIFNMDPEEDTAEQFEELQRDVETAVNLNTQIRNLDDELAINREFMTQVLRYSEAERAATDAGDTAAP